MVIEVIEPVGNSIDLIDLIPYTDYQLEIKDRSSGQLLATVSFNTSGKLITILLYQSHFFIGASYFLGSR